MEMDSQKNIFGIMLTISGTFSIIASNAVSFYSAALAVWVLLGFGIVLVIISLCFMETLVKGGALLFSGILLIISDVVLQIFIGPFSPRLLLWIGVLALLIGIVLSIAGFSEI